MITLEHIKQSEREIQKIVSLHENTSNSRMLKKLSAQYDRLNAIQNAIVMKYLEDNDTNYLALTKENMGLMVNKHIEFAVTSEQWGLFSSHATDLAGDVHENGYFYAQTVESNFIIFNSWQKMCYPLGFKGNVNCMGDANLKISEKGFALLGGRVPEKFIGNIDEVGNLHLKTTKTFWEYDGGSCVKKLIGDFFSGDTAKRKRFLDNRDKLETKISSLRETLV